MRSMSRPFVKCTCKVEVVATLCKPLEPMLSASFSNPY